MKKIFILILVIVLLSQSVLSENGTRSDAINAIADSEMIIDEMDAAGFSIEYTSDKLIEAKTVFEQVEYAEILRSSSPTTKQKREAEAALKLIEWGNLWYSEVIIYTEEISLRKEQAYTIYDLLTALELNVEANKKLDILEARNLLSQARDAFYGDRYEEAYGFMDQAKKELESQKTQSAAFNSMQRNLKNFIQRYWAPLIFLILAVALISFFSSKKVRRELLKRKIKMMKIEQEVLTNLLKESQIERFKKNKISGLVYNIRVEKYKTRLNEIKEELPILESKSKKKKRKHKTKKKK